MTTFTVPCTNLDVIRIQTLRRRTISSTPAGPPSSSARTPAPTPARGIVGDLHIDALGHRPVESARPGRCPAAPARLRAGSPAPPWSAASGRSAEGPQGAQPTAVGRCPAWYRPAEQTVHGHRRVVERRGSSTDSRVPLKRPGWREQALDGDLVLCAARRGRGYVPLIGGSQPASPPTTAGLSHRRAATAG